MRPIQVGDWIEIASCCRVNRINRGWLYCSYISSRRMPLQERDGVHTTGLPVGNSGYTRVSALYACLVNEWFE